MTHASPITRLAARLATAAALTTALLIGAAPATAQEKVRFSLDWRFDGPSAIFFLAKARGYFTDEGLDVSIDSGSGSLSAIQRIVGGSHDIAIADTSTLVEFTANNAQAPKMEGVYMLLEQLPASVFSLKKQNIKTPEDLVGKKMASPIFDAGRKTFPIFGKANRLDTSKVTWQSVDPALRETMLIKGEVDAITGFYYTAVLNFESRGVKLSDLNVMKYSDYGVNLYGAMIITTQRYAKENPKVVAAFLRATNRAVKAALADPKAAIVYLKERDPLIDSAIEEKRLRMYLENVATPWTRENGLGDINRARLRVNIVQVADAFGLKSYPNADELFTTNFLPPLKDRKP